MYIATKPCTQSKTDLRLEASIGFVMTPPPQGELLNYLPVGLWTACGKEGADVAGCICEQPSKEGK